MLIESVPSDPTEQTEIFVPGRLCILGEHTDWSAQYIKQNPSISEGYTLVCTTNEGLFTRVTSLDAAVLYFSHVSSEATNTFKVPLDVDQLKEIAGTGEFYSYVAGSALAVLESDQFEAYKQCCLSSAEEMKGISIDNYRTTLPMGKGLSSSAAVCVLVVTAFNLLYNLGISANDIMELAYKGEMHTPSRCGRMDQCVVMGSGAVGVMEFENNTCKLQRLHCASPLYFAVVDLKAHKDTVVILRDLNACFPEPSSPTQGLMHRYVQRNVSVCADARKAIENGSVADLAKAMTAAQTSFILYAAPNCPSQLTSPILYSVIDDPVVSELVLAVKGVGSQGDGSVQFLCANEEQQTKILEYMKEQYGMPGFKLTVPASTD